MNLTPEERRVIARRLAELESGAIDLQARGIDAREAAELRARLDRFTDNWDSPEMAAYDNYDEVIVAIAEIDDALHHALSL